MRFVDRLDFYSLDFIFINVLSSLSVSFRFLSVYTTQVLLSRFYWPIGNDKYYFYSMPVIAYFVAWETLST